MNKGASIVLVFYAAAMLSYGALEMGHDLLHYLAANHHSHLHDHGHSHHHHFSDHQHDQHTHLHHSHSAEPATSELPSLISFFLFCEPKPSFTFFNTASGEWKFQNQTHSESYSASPATPPPQG
ncbi:MAG TPA: hypothetical protein VGK59_04830 [Ohtaekwangia sp.]